MQRLNLDLIKNKRIERKITLQEMALLLGFKKATTYSNYENGVHLLKANMLPLLAEKFECNIEDFFTE